MSKFEIIKKYIDEYDYHGLLACHAPSDEFDSYSQRFAEVITENDTVEDIALLIAETMDGAFGEEIKPENFHETAQRIKKALSFGGGRQTMRVGIICAGDREVAPFLPIICACKTTEKAMLKFYEGTISGVEVVVLYSGVCKVNAAIAAQILIDTYRVNAIINAGVAGGMNPELEIFDTVIATEVAYHDVAPNILTEFHPWLETVFFKSDQGLLNLAERAVDKLGEKYKVFWGRMVTGEAFIADEGRQKINEEFAPLTVDMETASIAHVCYVNNIPFISIRSVTDMATHSGSEHFEENCEKASLIARDVTVALLAEIGNR